MREYTCNYHTTPAHVVGTATIAVPEDSATPLEDALSIARQTAPEETIFFVLHFTEGTTRNSRVCYTNYQPEAHP